MTSRKCLKKKRVQQLTEANRPSRLERSQALLDKYIAFQKVMKLYLTGCSKRDVTSTVHDTVNVRYGSWLWPHTRYICGCWRTRSSINIASWYWHIVWTAVSRWTFIDNIQPCFSLRKNWPNYMCVRLHLISHYPQKAWLGVCQAAPDLSLPTEGLTTCVSGCTWSLITYRRPEFETIY